MSMNQAVRPIQKYTFHLIVFAFGMLMLYPIFWTLASSLKPESEIFTHAGSLIPSSFQWNNYIKGWQGFGNTGFDVFFRNTSFLTVMTVVGSLITSSLVAFGFARIPFRYRSVLFACLLVTMMLPGQVTMIPQYILFHNLGWINTYLPLIVPHYIGGSPFYIFLLVQFMRGIPRELDEAAVIDGCSTYKIFGRIILPLCKPAIVTVAIFSFIGTWDDFMGPLIYLNDADLYTISLGLRLFSDPSSVTNWGYMFAMSTLSLLPLFIVFLFFQKHIIQGIATSGLKG